MRSALDQTIGPQHTVIRYGAHGLRLLLVEVQEILDSGCAFDTWHKDHDGVSSYRPALTMTLEAVEAINAKVTSMDTFGQSRTYQAHGAAA